MKEQNKPQLAGSKIIAAAVAAWFIYLSIDFLIHAVILTTWWKKTAGYWLSPEVSTILANYAVFAMPSSLLLVWSGSILIESTLACATASWVLDAERSWRRVGLVFGAAVLIFIMSVVLQNLLFPT